MKKQTTDEGFKKWFDEYFCNQQGDDSPYGYNDVKTAFEQGRLSALADVEKKIEKCVEPDTGLIFIGDLKQEIARLKGEGK